MPRAESHKKKHMSQTTPKKYNSITIGVIENLTLSLGDVLNNFTSLLDIAETEKKKNLRSF